MAHGKEAIPGIFRPARREPLAQEGTLDAVACPVFEDETNAGASVARLILIHYTVTSTAVGRQCAGWGAPRSSWLVA